MVNVRFVCTLIYISTLYTVYLIDSNIDKVITQTSFPLLKYYADTNYNTRCLGTYTINKMRR